MINILDKVELRKAIRENKPTCYNCGEHQATDCHHLNGDHQNNNPANLAPWCKRCHNTAHDISDNLTELTILARTWDRIQRERIATGNAITAYVNLRYDVPHVREVHARLEQLEKQTMKAMEGMLWEEPIYNLYLSRIKGIGPSIGAALISEIGDPGRFPTVSSLWAYCGLHVKDGEAPKKRRGQKANWNQKLKMFLAGRLADSFIKLRPQHMGRKLYDRYKAFYTGRDGESLSKGHVNNRARRKLVKVFVSCLWAAWREIKGLPVTKPYAMNLNGHTHLVTPEDWAGQDWIGL